MKPESQRNQAQRTLIIRSIVEPPTALGVHPSKGFVVMLPAFGNGDCSAALSVVDRLLELGCGEFCCVGTDAEVLHDKIDEAVEDCGTTEVVTTWHSNSAEGCEYFVQAAGGQASGLLALVREQRELCTTLRRIAAQSHSIRVE